MRQPSRPAAIRSAAAVLGLLALTMGPTVIAPAAAAASEGVSSEVAALITDRMQRDGIPGIALALTHGDQVDEIRGFGHDSSGARVSADTLFQIASLSKSFTALAVLQLVDRGLLALDDTVVSHLPEFRLADARGAQITVRQLLAQTSGLSDATSPDMGRPRPTSLADAVAGFRSVRLAAAPGAAWSYHNPNYEIAARLVEVVSGESFSEYLDRHIFDPAGMTSTTNIEVDTQPVPGLADGHVVMLGNAVPTPAPGFFVSGSGGVVTDARDMAIWLIVNAEGGVAPNGTRLVSPEGFAAWHHAVASNGYALGWDTDGPPDDPIRIVHTGNQLTFGSIAVVQPHDGLGVVLLFNSSTAFQDEQSEIAAGVLALVNGTDAPTGSTPGWVRDVLVLVTALIALAVGSVGALRSGRWVRRNAERPLRAVLRIVPAASLLVPVALFPPLASLIYGGREVTWVAAWYGWPCLVVAVAAVGLGAALTAVPRSILLARHIVRGRHNEA